MPRIRPEVENQVLSAIRNGALPWVAAATFGIDREDFQAWMEQGRLQRRGGCRRFRLKVLQARAQAFALAEREVRNLDVKFWLRYGPGPWRAGKTRTRPRSAKETDSLADPRFQRFLAGLLDLVEPRPELRRAVADLVDRVWSQAKSPTSRGDTP